MPGHAGRVTFSHIGPDTVLRRIDMADGAWRIAYDSAADRVFLLPNGTAPRTASRSLTAARTRSSAACPRLAAEGTTWCSTPPVAGSMSSAASRRPSYQRYGSTILTASVARHYRPPPSWSHIDQGQLRLNTRARILYVADILR